MSDRSPLDPGGDDTAILAAIVEASSDAIIGKDLRGTILSWNEGASRIYGYAADEMIGESISILIPDGHSDELPGILERIGRGERVRPFETERRTKDGRVIDVSLAVSPIRGGDGRIVGASAIAREITAQKRAERAVRSSEARLRSVVDSAVDAIIVIDARGRLESFNPAAERLFGYLASEVIGRNVTMLMPPPYREEHDGYLSHYLETGAQKVIGVGREVTGLRKDGTTFPLHLSVGEMTFDGERPLHRHPARPERSRADGTADARAGGARAAGRNGGGGGARGEESAGRRARRDSGHRQAPAARRARGGGRRRDRRAGRRPQRPDGGAAALRAAAGAAPGPRGAAVAPDRRRRTC